VAYRIAIDTGGTFTDLVLADERGGLVLGKSLTTYERIFVGIEGALKMAAEQAGASVADVLRNTDLVIYGTTHATNAIIERNTARTAFLVTEGFPDISCCAKAASSIRSTSHIRRSSRTCRGD
jgi:N-methylhydantoinase A